MNTEQLDHYYDIGDVEGIGLIDANGILREDQTVTAPALTAEIAQAFGNIHNSMKSVGRTCRHLVLRLGDYQYLSLEHQDGLILLQIRKGGNVQSVLHLAKDISVGDGVAVESAPTPSSWSEFKPALLSALNKVAPSNLALKLVDQARDKSGCSAPDEPTDLQLPLLCESILELVPNKARRNMLKRDLDLLLQKSL